MATLIIKFNKFKTYFDQVSKEEIEIYKVCDFFLLTYVLKYSNFILDF